MKWSIESLLRYAHKLSFQLNSNCLLFEAIPNYWYKEHSRTGMFLSDRALKITPTFASSYGEVKGKIQYGEISTINSERCAGWEASPSAELEV